MARMIQAIKLLPNMHLIIEGGMMDQTFEVYEVASDSVLTEPIYKIETGCRGLTAFETTDELIFMGFMLSMM